MSDVEYRTLDLVNKQIHQIKYPGGEWMNQAVITGWANNAQKLATQLEAIEGDE